MGFKRLLSAVGLAAGMLSAPVSASASTLDYMNSSVRTGITLSDVTSYDHTTAFTPFTGVLSNQLYELNSFTAPNPGMALQYEVLMRFSYYDGLHFAGGDSFGLSVNQNFNTLLSWNKEPGDSGQMVLNPGGSAVFALRNPDTTYYSQDSLNPDAQMAHMYAAEVLHDAQVVLPQTTLSGGSLTVNLYRGDLVLFWEDLCKDGPVSGICPVTSDRDYQDYTVLLRAQTVPEPASMLLFGAGLLGALGLRKRG